MENITTWLSDDGVNLAIMHGDFIAVLILCRVDFDNQSLVQKN